MVPIDGAALVNSVLMSRYFVLGLTVLYFLIVWIFVPRLGSSRNLGNIASNLWPLLVVAIGQTFVLIVAGIDLSQTSVMALASVGGSLMMAGSFDPALFSKSPLWGIVISEAGGPLEGTAIAVAAGIAVMLVLGAGIGAANGCAVAKGGMPAFMVTFVGLLFYQRLAIFLTKSENIMNLPPSFIALGKGSLLHIPFPAVIVVALAALAFYVMRKTLFGRWLYATGVNPKTANVSGVPVNRVIIVAYMTSGLCAAVGAILYTARLECGRPTLGGAILLDIIGANIIGGNSLFGGAGTVMNTISGALFFVVLGNSLSMMNLDSFTINIVKGSVILLAALVDVVRTKMSRAL